jgi:hypothetical protein
VKDGVLLGIIFICFIDWCVAAGSRFRFTYVVPLQPLIFLLMNDRVRRGSRNFFKTLYNAAEVFRLYFLFVLCATLLCLAMFRDRINTDPDPDAPFPPPYYNTFINFIRAMVWYLSCIDVIPLLVCL